VSSQPSLAAPAREWLEDRAWTWDEDEDADGLVLAVISGTGDDDWRWYIQVRDEHHQLALFTILASPVPLDRRPEMSQMVVTASFGLTVGSFELDLDEGQLRFRTSIGFGGAEVSNAQVRSLLDEMERTNRAMVKGYWPAITAVLEGRPGVEAVRGVEGP